MRKTFKSEFGDITLVE